MSQDTTPQDRSIAVVGATGHTARFVIEELLRRKLRPIAIARNPDALAKAQFSGDVIRRHLRLNDAASLDAVLKGAHAVINCAGPFVDFAEDVVAAALRARIHYVDVTAEEPSARRTLENFDASAREAGVAVIPSVGFYGALGDLLVTAALGDWASADTVELMIGLDRWHPTLGTRKTLARLSEAAAAEPHPPRKKHWDFGEPLGQQVLVEFALTERLLILRHVRTSDLRIFLSEVALGDVTDPTTPVPEAVDPLGRSSQRFVVEALVTRGQAWRRATARGIDAYAFTAPLVCEVTTRLLDGRLRENGAHAPGEILDATDLLMSLSPEPVKFEIATS